MQNTHSQYAQVNTTNTHQASKTSTQQQRTRSRGKEMQREAKGEAKNASFIVHHNTATHKRKHTMFIWGTQYLKRSGKLLQHFPTLVGGISDGHCLLTHKAGQVLIYRASTNACHKSIQEKTKGCILTTTYKLRSSFICISKSHSPQCRHCEILTSKSDWGNSSPNKPNPGR